MFKEKWEKTSTEHQLSQEMIEQMVQIVCPTKKLILSELIAGGCANLNIKIQIENNQDPLVLRVYLRDQEACFREQKLANLLRETVPIPQVYQIGEIDGYHFALTEFMPGITLRELLLGDLPHDIRGGMYEVGQVLLRIAEIEFPKAGFFNKDLNIAMGFEENFALNFAQKCLQNEKVIAALTRETISEISDCVDKYSYLFPDENEKHLVHADFDPANILVDRIDGTWKVTGVLDWEFSFSGSALCDVASMLRYAHKMPSEFQDSFLKGLRDGGIRLPENVGITIDLLNLLSLLDLLTRSDPKSRPNQCADIYELIDHILTMKKKEKK